MSNSHCIKNIRKTLSNNSKHNETQTLSIVKNIKVQIITRVFRKYHSIIKFYKQFMLNKIESEIFNSLKKIQRIFRKYLLKLTFKKSFIKRKIYDCISQNITILQKHVRRHLIYYRFKGKLQGKFSNYYLINGDINQSIKQRISKLDLIKYDYEKGEDTMKYYNFDYVKSLDRHILFLPKSDINKENTLVNFVADGDIIINENFPVYKYGNKNYYNILNLSLLSNKNVPNTSQENQNLPKNLLKLEKYFNVNNYNIIYCSNPIKKFHKADNPMKKINSSLNIKQILNFNPILKGTSKNVLHSSKSSNKKVSFQFV